MSVAASATGSVVTARADCLHCGAPLPDDAVVGAKGAFCCTGCAAAAEWIREAALGDYYQLRTVPAGRVDAGGADFSAWDRDVVLAEHSRVIPGGREITVLTDAMRCAACAWLIDRALRRHPGVLDAGANAVTGRIVIAWDPAKVALSGLMSRLSALGYRPWLATGEAREQARRRDRRRWLLRLGVAGLGALQAMMFAEALYLDSAQQMPTATRDFFRWITFLVSTPVVFYSGWPFLEGMWNELRGRRLGMDTLIASSTLLAYFASLVETLRGGAHVWYDAAVMFVLLLLVARMFEQRARGVASAQVDALARARPALATREARDGQPEQVPVGELAVGDVVRVATGEAVPADGVLLDQSSSFDEALITGESAPVRRDPGEGALAGSVCREQAARLRVTRVGADTRLSELTRLVEHAQGTRPQLARIAERVSAAFLVVLVLCAVATFAWWRMHEPARAFEVTLALLVVSCPCALSLAIPTALTVAHGALARMGVLGLRGDALATLARVDRVILDKTGTLSNGRPQLDSVEAFDGFDTDTALAIAAALERESGHPLAQAFIDVASPHVAQEVRAVAGMGIEGRVDGEHWRLGRADFAADGRDDGALWLGRNSRAVSRFGVRETLRDGARDAVAGLREAGIAVELCSGDAPVAVARFARQVGIDDVHARQTPEQKLALVRERQSRGEVVAMVGDGLNDAPVLAGADVSLAMAEGAALAQRAADFVVTSPSLLRVPQAIALARRTQAVVRQNLAWALGYNVLAIPLAATGHVTPWIAALGMAGSSLLVTLNALRLGRSASTARHRA
ncbi:heavy metal translocating P-type ATPase [Lysobacter sp. LF1]|uniref:Heavy metal translocating P-type ATPase n=1 Tax=Lysobacter stagni TaxID=3045172 RepID=A0ABT6XEP4_9GAMM|nr:heavy metal translocating P-type ATPase [Lysobacter sp. LF1]MDI9238614.1 heavy metal translocating P-type ATPase [Lysobacter sp. LF1]